MTTVLFEYDDLVIATCARKQHDGCTVIVFDDSDYSAERHMDSATLHDLVEALKKREIEIWKSREPKP